MHESTSLPICVRFHLHYGGMAFPNVYSVRYSTPQGDGAAYQRIKMIGFSIFLVDMTTVCLNKLALIQKLLEMMAL